jgi:hypothetical protein
MRDKGSTLHGRVVWKDRRDGNHGKRGWVAGNPRYRRNARKPHPADRTMGRN